MQSGGLSKVKKRCRNHSGQYPKEFHLDKLPRGKQRGKFCFGSKIAALNFRKLFGFRKGFGNYTKNPVLV